MRRQQLATLCKFVEIKSRRTARADLMEVQFLASAPESPADRLYASSYLINRTVAIDAGCLGYCGMPQDQTRVQHIFLTHSHADHTASLPIMVENAFDPTMPAVTVHGLPETLDAVRKHIFNDVIWPDFIRLSHPGTPIPSDRRSYSRATHRGRRIALLPVMVEHVVPTVAYIVTDGRSTVIFGGDSGPTTRLWELAHQIPAAPIGLPRMLVPELHDVARRGLEAPHAGNVRSRSSQNAADGQRHRGAPEAPLQRNDDR